jgi:hypothetical protein
MSHLYKTLVKVLQGDKLRKFIERDCKDAITQLTLIRYLVNLVDLFYYDLLPCNRIRVMVFNATFNNISAISWWSVVLVEEAGVPGFNDDIFCVILKLDQ